MAARAFPKHRALALANHHLSINVSVKISPSVWLNPGQGLGRSILPGPGESQKPSLQGEVALAHLSSRPRAGRTCRRHGKHVLPPHARERRGLARPQAPISLGWEARPQSFHLSPLPLVPGSGLNHFPVFSVSRWKSDAQSSQWPKFA